MIPGENKNLENEGVAEEGLGEDFSAERGGAKNPPIEKLEVVENVAEEKIENEAVKEIPRTETEAIKSVEQEQKVEETSQAENLPPVEIQEVENATVQIPAQPQTKIVEQIVYKTDPLIVANTPTGAANFVQKLLIKARAKIQERKRKKLDKIMLLFETKSEIRSGDVRKSLFVKKRTATNYLNQLEREQRIIQMGKKGSEVFYVKKS